MKFRATGIDFVVGGLLLWAAGACLAIYSALHYRLGTIDNFGPGMFPTIIGVLLSVLGFFNLLKGFSGTGRISRVEWRPAVFVLAGIAAFAVLVAPFGLLPAVSVLVVLVSLADSKIRLHTMVFLNIVLMAMAALIFDVGLNVPLRLASWPSS